MLSISKLLLCCMAAFLLTANHYSSNPRRVEILFLGHVGTHHNADQLVDIMAKEYFKSGINITYTTRVDDLNEKNLKLYDGLVLYANYDSITAAQEKALLSFVKEGKGFIPIHCASWCFRNSKEVVELIGGQFLRHGYDSFPAMIVQKNHPVMKGIEDGFLTKDETYIHSKLSKKIQILSERQEGNRREPYTWVQEFGKGRVFYTAYGHDEITFNNPQFLNLVKNGILWAVGDKAVEDLAALTLADPSYSDAKIPNYEKRDPAPKLQAPLSPAESMSQIQIPAGFELKLFASEPDIINPIYMNWDERGRLWVIETIDYPNTVRDDKEQGDDRIRIIEDTDGDGKADKFTLFADKLNIPTSFTFSNGGIIVSQAPYFLFLKDENGDDRADVKDTIMKGWGISDTHAGPSNLRYGLDNNIWGTVGYSGFSGTIGTEVKKFSQGIYHFKSNTKKVNQFEFLGGTSNNTWGLGFSEEFDVFASTANNTHSVFFGVPKRLLSKVNKDDPGTEKIDSHYPMHVVTKNLRQVDVFGGFTAAAGHSLYTARQYPSSFWNKTAFVTEPTGRLIHTINLKQSGAGFKEIGDGRNLLVSADEWCAPIQAEVGPDGNVWVTDWYDFIIQHNPTPTGYETGKGNAHVNPLRDHERGRIYRIVYKNATPAKKISLNKNDKAGLIAALSSNNMFWRTTAQRLLVELGDASVANQLYPIILNQKLDEVGINAPAIHALWTLHGLGLLDGSHPEASKVAEKALTHSAAGVRRAAVEVLKNNINALQWYKQAKVLSDKDLRVRLAVVIAIADSKASPEGMAALSEMNSKQENKKDHWISKALNAAMGITTTVSKEDKISNSTKADQLINLSVVKEQMKYSMQQFTVKAGTIVRLTLTNPDFMQHNLLILQPGSTERVGAAADKLATEKNGADLQYIPKMGQVLFSMPLVNPQKSYTITFKVPAIAGDYPYICTFPGHWRIMNGVMKVVSK